MYDFVYHKMTIIDQFIFLFAETVHQETTYSEPRRLQLDGIFIILLLQVFLTLGQLLYSASS